MSKFIEQGIELGDGGVSRGDDPRTSQRLIWLPARSVR